MSGPSYTGTVSGLRVTERIDGAHPKQPQYPLLPGDLLIEQEDRTFYKFGPGLGIVGFVLTDEQRATLEPVEDQPVGVGSFAYAFGDDA